MSHPAIEQTKSLLPTGQDASIADRNTMSSFATFRMCPGCSEAALLSLLEVFLF
ncbi:MULTISPECIES: hypothetical protein [Paenibacillus]|uniref:Uncharacterized protein n=1 Tax=Paenibacillus albilobatus TaxID=2716884 RepID=A0A919XC81_9BACL|nr:MULTISPECIES: hypothetical protein [Paenibacillus]GIO28979.1 hypothetical protein J2TS6_01200 [Paenibacillus albilobatus]